MNSVDIRSNKSDSRHFKKYIRKIHETVKYEIENRNGNVSKIQQPDQGAENTLRPHMDLQLSEKNIVPGWSFSWPLNKHVI